MRILMLGWEFPPFIAGGLATACYGLTRALRRQGHEIVFVVPKPIEGEADSPVTLLGPHTLRHDVRRVRELAEGSASDEHTELAPVAVEPGFGGSKPIEVTEHGQTTVRVPAPFSSPYQDFGGDIALFLEHMSKRTEFSPDDAISGLRSSSARVLAAAMERVLEVIEPMASDNGYGVDLFGDSQRYAQLVAALGVRQRFDVIHAHDWLTYPAGMLLKSLTGKPLVCHVHATEFDRSGEHINQGVYDIERAGMHAADRVITVSRLTKSIATRRYGVNEDKVHVVYNGVNQDTKENPGAQRIEQSDKIVLFLGRITMQKGPEYFIGAAKRVLEKIDNVKFVVAGSGDMALRMIDMAAGMGIGHKVLFTGFLRGRDVDRVFSMADCYVMPSVSEPFGIAPLEAMQNDTPVIISKQSGVSEVLTHALKVDFWDIDEMANKVVAVLKYPPLSQTLREHGAFELRGLTWDGAAEKCVKVYGRAIAS